MKTAAIRFDHIAIAVERMAGATRFLMGKLGGVPVAGGPSGVYRWGQWRFANRARIELIEPMGQHSFLHRFLARRGPGIHHATFTVPSLREACARAEAHGYTIVGYDDSNPEWVEAFLHPKQALGIVVQLAESSGDPQKPRLWQPPPGPENPPPPVTIVGLRMRARSRERAGTQWKRILKGECIERIEGELIYRWPDAPMRVVVEIDPSADEGPVCIELASDRRISCPQGPHPVLGAVFMQRAEPVAHVSSRQQPRESP